MAHRSAARMPDRRWRRRLRPLLGLAVLTAGASLAQPLPHGAGAAPAFITTPAFAPVQGPADLSLLTYNVKGLPWPVATGREPALRRIGARLARLRTAGAAPAVVVLQEAFTPEAKAIGEIAGYRWRITGPYGRAGPGNPVAGNWLIGETQDAMLDSGLMVLSDLPVLAIERAAFPAGACAGYDCLAAKGVLMVTVAVPGKGPVTIATTHLNSRRASGADFERTHLAYRRQTEFAAGFLQRHRAPGAPLIVAGDFNRGERPARIAALGSALDRLAGAASFREGLSACLARLRDGRDGDAAHVQRRGRDLQFAFDGDSARLEPVDASIPFGTEADGSSLSDHFGFEVRYRLKPVKAPLSSEA